MKKAARVVFIPSPGVGHLVSSMEFAKVLINRDDRLWITVLVMKLPSDTPSAAYTHSFSSPRLQVINLPSNTEPSQSTPTPIPTAVLTLVEQQKAHVKEALSNLTSAPPLAAFIVDTFCVSMIDIAKEFGVPSLVFFTSGLAFLGLMLHLHTLREQEKGEFRDSHTELAIPSFANPVPSTALPSLLLDKEWEPLFMALGRGLKDADGIIVNSFEELESHALHSFANQALRIYPVGPIINPKPHADAESASAHNSHVFHWLDHQPPSSVVFLCFGSMGSLGEDQVKEVARALEESGARFLWSLRKPQPKGSNFMTSPSDYSPSDMAAVLPPGFLDRIGTAGIGKVIGWAPQAQILAHPATGAFVSHCGWNSTLESIYFGVPIATWPLYAEQQTNAFLLVRELNISAEVALDYRVGPNTLLSAEQIAKGIRSALSMDEDTRNRLKEISKKSRNTLLEPGSSYSHLGRLIHYIMNHLS